MKTLTLSLKKQVDMIQEKDMQAPREEMEQMFNRQYSQCKELKEHKDYADIMSEWFMGRKFYVASDVDAVLSEKDAAIAEIKDKCQMHDFFWEGCGFAKRGFKNTIAVSEAFDRLEAENAELKQKLEDAKATHYAEMVDVGMENRRLKEERRWRKFTEEKPSEEMEGEDFLVSNGYYSVVCEWRGYWNNDPFCGDKNCDVVKYWMPLPSAPEEDK